MFNKKVRARALTIKEDLGNKADSVSKYLNGSRGSKMTCIRSLMIKFDINIIDASAAWLAYQTYEL